MRTTGMSKITLVKLHKYKVGNPTRYVWKLVWWGLQDGVRTRFKETIGSCREMTKRDAELLRAEKEIAIGSRQISPNKLVEIVYRAWLHLRFARRRITQPVMARR